MGIPVFRGISRALVCVTTGLMAIALLQCSGDASNPNRTLKATEALLTSWSWMTKGEMASAWYGFSVASAGDVDGDGFGDVVVGAPGHNGEEGRAYLYYGSASGLAQNAAWTVSVPQGQTPPTSFGWSVAGAGDVNGDGYSDVIIGAPYHDHTWATDGRVYVYPGGPTRVANEPWILETGYTAIEFGYAVAAAGDVNNDGFADIVVGAPNTFWYTGSTDGLVFVYYGSASQPGQNPLTAREPTWLTDPGGAGNLGFAVAGAGDVDGDGFDDVFAGAPYVSNGHSAEGRALLYRGGVAGADPTPIWSVEGGQNGVNVGGSVSSAGDVNGDGYADILVGAWGYNNGQVYEGAAFVYFGTGSGTGVSTGTGPLGAGWWVEGNVESGVLGRFVGSAGDVNGDGFGDIVIGSPYYTEGQPLEGRALVYYGRATNGFGGPWVVQSGLEHTALGAGVASAGDVDGDGLSDVIVGAALYDEGGLADRGAAYVYSGRPRTEVPAAANRVLCNPGGCLPVRYSAQAGSDTEVVGAANDFAAVLGRMAGSTVSVEAVSEFDLSGIWLLTAAQAEAFDITGLSSLGQLSADGILGRESFEVRSHPTGLLVVGSTSIALRNAVWALLHRLGYRQYFPEPLWEHVPQQAQIKANAWAFVHRPPFRMRFIFPGYGTWQGLDVGWNDWARKNGISYRKQELNQWKWGGSHHVNAGHSYDGLISGKASAFAEHPEWRPQVGGVRTSKLCTTSPGLIDVAVSYYASIMTDGTRSVSVDPSDGGGWLECDDGAENLIPISDRAVYFANEVGKRLPHGTITGMYAYNEHSPPPTIDVEPHVAVLVATKFNKSTLTFEQLVTGWRAKHAHTGVRDYFAVNTWDRDKPGVAAAAKPTPLVNTLRRYKELALEHLSAESSDAWGPLGMGHYLATRELYGTTPGELAPTMLQVIETLFPASRVPMREFYETLTGENGRTPLLSADLLHRLYAALQSALGQTSNVTEQQRIRHLALYVRYIELWMKYSASFGDDRQAAFEQLIRFAYRIRSTRMVHSLALYRDLDGRDGTVSVPEDAQWNDPEPANPWKSSTPYNDAEIDAMIAAGISNNPRAPFDPVGFSDQLVPANPPGAFTGYGRGSVAYYRDRATFRTYRPTPGAFAVTMVTDIVPQGSSTDPLTRAQEAAARRNAAAPIPVALYEVGAATETPLFSTTVHSDWTVGTDAQGRPVLIGSRETVCLCANDPGHYELVVSDYGNGFQLYTPEDGDRWVFESGPDSSGAIGHRWNMYMYVPKGTTRVGVYTGNTTSGNAIFVPPSGTPACLVDWTGSEPCSLSSKPAGYYAFAVLPGEDGKVWRVQFAAGPKLLFTTPIQLAHDADEFLLPKDVAIADGIVAPSVTVSPVPAECATVCN